MKVLVFASSAFPRWKDDAIPSFVSDLCSELAKGGVEVSALLPRSKGEPLSEDVGGVKVHRFRYFFPSSMERLCYGAGIIPNMRQSILARLQLPFLVVSEFFSLWRVAQKEKPGIIHAHWILPQGFTAAIIGRLFRIPVIITAHAGDVFPLGNLFFRLLSRVSISSAAAVTANSSFTMAAVGKIAKPRSISVIPMGVDLKLFSSASSSAAAAMRKKHAIKGKMLLFVGRLAEKKCARYLVAAIEDILKKFPAAKLVIVGDGPEKAALVRQSQQLGLSGSIIFAGSVANQSLPPYYRAADVFVLPSIVDSRGDTEGLGVVLLEAITAGIPVVASNVGGIPDIVIHGKTGLLVGQKNPWQLAEAVIRILSGSELRKKLAVAAKAHVVKSYSWEKIAGDFHSLLEACCRHK